VTRLALRSRHALERSSAADNAFRSLRIRALARPPRNGERTGYHHDLQFGWLRFDAAIVEYGQNCLGLQPIDLGVGKERYEFYLPKPHRYPMQ
jgi:hypothetical protein